MPPTVSRAGLLTAFLLAGLSVAHATEVPGVAVDPYLWLEEVSSPRALQWVVAENAKTQAVLETDRRYPGLYRDALAIAQSRDRLPRPRFIAGQVYDFWQDADHVRGIWRRTSLAGYRQASPAWSTVLDLDALARREAANWFWQGSDCLRPAQRRCLIELSDGGEDAVTVREFDTGAAAFVEGGFVLPKGKQNVAWAAPDELLVAREWGEGTLTASGYAFIVKALGRGQPLDAAREVFRGKPTDVAVWPSAQVDAEGHSALLIQRDVTFFEHEHYILKPSGPVRLGLPAKSGVEGLVAGRLIVRVEQAWTTPTRRIQPGSLVALDWAAVVADPAHLKPVPVYEPAARSSLGEVAITRSHLVVTSAENVRGRAAVYTPRATGRWLRRGLTVPDMADVNIVAADPQSEDAIIGVRSFLLPTSQWLADTQSGALTRIKELPAQFDASRHVVEQREATSPDGTRIPYFVVRPRELKPAGDNPTIMTAYGGFQVSYTPFYSALTGKLWLERGGTFVLANIRGGGEFGPAWHEAGLKTHRQRIYDDFAAVARDLFERKITSPRRLGIEGGSNGGLLMGVEFTQHPDYWRAVDIQIPLLDMLRYEQIAAGASWVGEYGSVSVPEERAFLEQISPYQQLRAGVAYPTPLIWTTTRDDRVGPQHARKFAARLAELGSPYLYYEVIEGGHGAGANLEEKAHTTALEITYFTRQLVD